MLFSLVSFSRSFGSPVPLECVPFLVEAALGSHSILQQRVPQFICGGLLHCLCFSASATEWSLGFMLGEKTATFFTLCAVITITFPTKS